MAVAGSSSGLYKTIFPTVDESSAVGMMTAGENMVRDDESFRIVQKAFIDYFGGVETAFSFSLDLRGYTDFQKDVLTATYSIPYGQLQSYGWIADRIGRPGAARAVGQALGLNRLPILVPCHRVVRSDGSLGGFSAGLHWKKRLLNLENSQ